MPEAHDYQRMEGAEVAFVIVEREDSVALEESVATKEVAYDGR